MVVKYINPIANSRYEAISLALDGHDALWAYAVTQGYRVRWLRETRDE